MFVYSTSLISTSGLGPLGPYVALTQLLNDTKDKKAFKVFYDNVSSAAAVNHGTNISLTTTTSNTTIINTIEKCFIVVDVGGTPTPLYLTYNATNRRLNIKDPNEPRAYLTITLGFPSPLPTTYVTTYITPPKTYTGVGLPSSSLTLTDNLTFKIIRNTANTLFRNSIFV